MNLICFRKYLVIFKVKMSSLINTSITPIGVRGMKCLDRDKFTREITLPILKLSEDKVDKITKICKSYFLKLENFKPIQKIEPETSSGFNKCIYFDPDKVTEWDQITEKDRISLGQYGINQKNFDSKKTELLYENFRYDVIFKAVLPENEEVVSGFSQIGHVIHLNLREHLLEYRTLIGQVLVDKIKTCRTVVNKNSTIDNTYRNFCMEVIAGDEDFLVTVKENKCIFQFDFSKVYWNSRLCKEHERILGFLRPGDVLFDVFCGVGPFAVPAAKQKCKVFANDLNPESFKWLNHNAKKNKLKMDLFNSYNMDGKDFILNIFKTFIMEYCKGIAKINDGAKIHITMNLPAIAVDFLKYFKGLIENMELKDKFDLEVIIYVYCFAIGEDPYEAAKQMVIDNFDNDISSNILDIFDVRNVSPKKEMMRVTIKLTKDIVFKKIYENSEPPSKKLCIEAEEKL